MQPYCYFAATLLFLSYIIGLWFTLRTHAAVIWNNEIDEKKSHVADSQLLAGVAQPAPAPHAHLQRQVTSNSSDPTRVQEVRDSHLYKKILGQSLRQVGLTPRGEEVAATTSSPNQARNTSTAAGTTSHLVPPKSSGNDHVRSDVHIPGFTDAENNNLVREVAEIAASAATFAAQSAARSLRNGSVGSHAHGHPSHQHAPAASRSVVLQNAEGEAALPEVPAAGGHDAPNWSRAKSSIILMGATILYALIAEILVNTVDVILKGFAIDEKFVGITLFALVPNTTEFLVSSYVFTINT